MMLVQEHPVWMQSWRVKVVGSWIRGKWTSKLVYSSEKIGLLHGEKEIWILSYIIYVNSRLIKDLKYKIKYKELRRGIENDFLSPLLPKSQEKNNGYMFCTKIKDSFQQNTTVKAKWFQTKRKYLKYLNLTSD